MTVLAEHQALVRSCRACPRVAPPPILGTPVASPIYLLGQAPGIHEGEVGRPFGWTAGRVLFRWFASMGADEDAVRARVYFAAVLRCFPGKAKGGDRVPAPDEVARCRGWIVRELDLLRPKLVIAVGRLAMEQIADPRPLASVVGPVHHAVWHGHPIDWVALPHPSGVSAWPKVEPGRTLLAHALTTLAAHPTWKETFG